MVIVENLRKSFGVIRAVDGVDFRVSAGDVLGFLGPNGAGKSTTMRMISGFIRPDGGRVEVAGYDVVQSPRNVQQHLGYLPEGAPAWDDMRVDGFLDFIARVRAIAPSARRTRIAETAERTGLEHVLKQTIGTLSKGYRRRVGLAQAIIHDPDVLVLDEPTDGLDPVQKYQVRALIQKMRDKAIIISTHILEEVEALCNRAVIIDHGRVVQDTTPAALAAQAPDFGVIHMKIHGARVREFATACLRIDAVEGVEVNALDDETLEVDIRPKQKQNIVSDCHGLVNEYALNIMDFRMERGSMDRAFRAITYGEER